MSTLDTLRLALLDRELTGRGAQVETGASQVLGCRAEAVLRLAGTPKQITDPGWKSAVGTAIHAFLEQVLPADKALVEHLTHYRGVPARIDRCWYNGVLTDWKTKDDAAGIGRIRTHGPDLSQRAQIMVGAAGLIDEGYDVHTVELVFLPRAGNLSDAWTHSEPFNRALADEAADWVAETNALAQDFMRDGDIERLRPLRDKAPSWCHQFCPYVDVCRLDRSVPVDDPEVIQAAADHVEGKALIDAGKQMQDWARPILYGQRAVFGHFRVTTSEESVRIVEEPDMAELAAAWQMLNPDVPIPVRKVEKVIPSRLTVTPVKAKRKPAVVEPPLDESPDDESPDES